MTFGPTNGGKLCNVRTHNVIWADEMTESFVYRWQHAPAWFDVTCFPQLLEHRTSF